MAHLQASVDAEEQEEIRRCQIGTIKRMSQHCHVVFFCETLKSYVRFLFEQDISFAFWVEADAYNSLLSLSLGHKFTMSNAFGIERKY